MKKFEIPNLEVIELSVMDIVTTSEEEPPIFGEMGSSCV